MDGTDKNTNGAAGPIPPQPGEIQEALGRGYHRRSWGRKTRESRVDQGVSAFLDALPCCWYVKTHGHALQVKGLPDFIGCYRGVFFGFEDKPPAAGVEPGLLQKIMGHKILRAGGIWGIARHASDAAALLAPVLEQALILESVRTQMHALHQQMIQTTRENDLADSVVYGSPVLGKSEHI